MGNGRDCFDSERLLYAEADCCCCCCCCAQLILRGSQLTSIGALVDIVAIASFHVLCHAREYVHGHVTYVDLVKAKKDTAKR